MTARRFYPREEPLKVADLLRNLADVIQSAGWDERGGYLIRNDRGEPVSRTKWLPRAQWWAERPYSFSERQCAGILLKHIKAERALTRRELHCLRDLLRVAGILADQPTHEIRETQYDEAIPF
jgi:hypothetical protein